VSQELLVRQVQQQRWPRTRNTERSIAVIFFGRLQLKLETVVVFNWSPNSLLKEIGLRISVSTGESREASSLYQRISVLVQRFNSILLHDSLPTVDCADSIYPPLFNYL